MECLSVYAMDACYEERLCTFRKLMEILKDLKITEGFDYLESIELVAIDKRKFFVNRLLNDCLSTKLSPRTRTNSTL